MHDDIRIHVDDEDGDYVAIRADKLDGIIAAVSGNSEFDDLPDKECKHLPEGKYLVLKAVDIIINYKH